MKFEMIGISAVALAAFMTTPAAAGNAFDIVGTWDCIEQGSAHPDGLSGPGYQLDFVVSRQKGPVFNGHVVWTEDKADVAEHQFAVRTILADSGENVTFRAQIYGAFTFEPGRFAFTESGDPGYHFGNMLDQDTIEFVYLESGKSPMAALRLCKRR